MTIEQKKKPSGRLSLDKTPSPIGDLGLVGASFASVLVIASLSSLDESLTIAAKYFAVCIPVAITSYAVAQFEKEVTVKKLKIVIRVIHLALFVFAQIGCFLGIRYIFVHLAIGAGDLFTNVALICYLGAALLLLVIRIIDSILKPKKP